MPSFGPEKCCKVLNVVKSYGGVNEKLMGQNSSPNYICQRRDSPSKLDCCDRTKARSANFIPRLASDASESRKLAERAKVITPRPLFAVPSCRKCNESLMAPLWPQEAWLVVETSGVLNPTTHTHSNLHCHVGQPMHFNKWQQLNIYRGFIVSRVHQLAARHVSPHPMFTS